MPTTMEGYDDGGGDFQRMVVVCIQNGFKRSAAHLAPDHVRTESPVILRLPFVYKASKEWHGVLPCILYFLMFYPKMSRF